jgi:hypothetical protein
MKNESDAKTPGRRILRVVVVASDKDIDGLSVEDEDGNPAIQVRVHVETSEKGEGGVNVWFDSLGSTVYRDSDPADFAEAAGYELELMAERLEEEDFSSEEIDAALATAEWDTDPSLGRMPPLGKKPPRTG